MGLKKRESRFDKRFMEEFYPYIYADLGKKGIREQIELAMRIPQIDTGIAFEYALTHANTKLKHCEKGNYRDFTDGTDAKCVFADGDIKQTTNGVEGINPTKRRARVDGKNKTGALRVCVYVPASDRFDYFFIPHERHEGSALSIQYEDGALDTKWVAKYQVESLDFLANMKGNSVVVVEYRWK